MTSTQATHAGAGRQLVIHGGGGHGLVVAEAAAASGWTVLGFRDDRLEPHATVGCWHVMSPNDARITDPTTTTQAWHHVAVGDNATRQRMTDELVGLGMSLATIVHPQAYLSPSARIDPGVYVGPFAVIHAEARVSRGAIINTAAVVEHHNRIGAFAHLAPRATLTGRITVGERAIIGVGACVQPGMSVGEDSIVGGGAVVTRPIPPGVTAMGIPARVRSGSHPDNE